MNALQRPHLAAAQEADLVDDLLRAPALRRHKVPRWMQRRLRRIPGNLIGFHADTTWSGGMTAERFLARPLPGGWLRWQTAEPGGVAVLMPAPDPAWPAPLHDAYIARVEANLTGRCPRCSMDVTVTPVAPREASAVLTHEADCPVGDESWARHRGPAA